MRQTQSRSSWSHYAKVAAVFTLTTATYLVARTTGWLPSWLSGEKPVDDFESTALSISSTDPFLIPPLTKRDREDFESMSSVLADFQLVELTTPSIPEGNSDKALAQLTRQHLLQQQSPVTVVNPVPDQIVEVGKLYSYLLDNVFSGSYTLLAVKQTSQMPLPIWLNLQYKQLSTLPVSASISNALSVVTSGRLAFVVNLDYYTYTVQILDLTMPTIPRFLSTVLNVTIIQYNNLNIDIVVKDDLLFAALLSEGLQIYNVSLPSVPVRLSTVFNDGNHTIQCIAVSGNLLFAVDSTDLHILDVSTPNLPSIVSTTPDISGYYMSVSDSLLVVGGGRLWASYQLQIVNVSIPSAPHFLSQLLVPSDIMDLVISGETLFVAASYSGLQIVDLSLPSTPNITATVSCPYGQDSELLISDNLMFIAAGGAGLQIVDVTVPSAPVILSTLLNNAGNIVESVGFFDSILIVTDSIGIRILNMSQASLIGIPPWTQIGQLLSLVVNAFNSTVLLNSNVFILSFDQLPRLPIAVIPDQSLFPGESLVLSLKSDLLFTNPGESFLWLEMVLLNGERSTSWLNLTFTPLTVSNFFPGGDADAFDVAVSGGLLFVAGRSGFEIVDVSAPSAPRLLSTIANNTVSTIAYGVAVSGTTVFVADYENGLLIIDVSIPWAPFILSRVANTNSADWAYKVAISSNLLFVLYGLTSLHIFDVSVPITPHLLSIVENTESCFAVSGTWLFTGSNGVLEIIDVSNASAPHVLSTVANASGCVAVFDNMVYVVGTNFVDTSNGLQVVDVSVPSVPQVLSTLPRSTISEVVDIAVSGNILFLANPAVGLQVVDVRTPNIPYLLFTVSNQADGYAEGGAIQGNAQAVAVSGNTVFMAYQFAAVQIIDLSQWQLQGTPREADVGNYQLQISVTDGLKGFASAQPFTIRVEGPPQLNGSIPLQRAWVGQPFNYFIPPDLFVDPNDDVIDYSADLVGGKKLPGWLRFNPRIVGFGGIAQSSDAGNVTIVLSATDHICPEIPTVNFTVLVGFLPVLSRRIVNQLAPIGLPYRFAMPKNSFYDPDSLALSYLAQGVNNQPLPSWLRFNSTSLMFSGVANTSSITVYTLQLIATNSAGGQVIAAFTLRTDHFPALNKTLSLPMAVVNQPWVWTLPNDAFTDADGDSLTYSATQDDDSALPLWLSFNPITRVFTGAPLLTGIQGVKLTAQDIYGGSDSTYLNITVLPESQSGSVITPPRARTGKSFVFQVPPSSFSSSGVFNYSASLTDGASLPSWLQFIASNLSFVGLPNISDVGSYDVTLTATDTQGDHYNVSFMLNVNPNYPPQVRLPISNQVAQVGEPFVFYAPLKTFVDLNDDNLTYTVNSLPSWLSFDPSQLKFSGTPSRSDTDPLSARRVNVELTAHDDQSQTSTLFTRQATGVSP